MPDTIGALDLKKRKLIDLKRCVKDDADRQIAEIDRQIADVDKAIGIVNDAVKDIICPVCGGSGSVRRSDAAGQMEDVTCLECKGTGIKI